MIGDLEPDEKTTIGKRIERLIRMRFDLPRGAKLDVALAGEDVDIKTSCSDKRSWMFSRSNVDHVNLLIAYDEKVSTFDIGLVVITEDILSAHNQDKKRGLLGPKGKQTVSRRGIHKADGRILWLAQGRAYPKNQLQHLAPETFKAILAGSSGAERVKNMFVALAGTPVRRRFIAAVANQKDPLRRLRGSDGARGALDKAGLKLYSGRYDKLEVENKFGIKLALDEFLSVRAP